MPINQTFTIMTNIEQETMAAIKNFCRTHNEVNWEQVRVQAAIAAMQGFISSPVERCSHVVAVLSVKQADELVEELKRKEHKL